MKEITKDTVLAEHNKTPRKKCFHDNSEVQKRKEKPTFSVSVESAKKVFEAQTGMSLIYNPKYGNYYQYVNDQEIAQIEEWERNQGRLIYLRDCLSLSVAIDTNFLDNTSGQYTEMGALEYKGKNNRDQNSITRISKIVTQTIKGLPSYKDADLICSVPPRPDKDFDLPSSVTQLVSTKVDKQDVTGGFVFNGQKSSVKAATFDMKWNVWEDAQVSFQNRLTFNVNDKTVILIDDKYQSGITIQ